MFFRTAHDTFTPRSPCSRVCWRVWQSCCCCWPAWGCCPSCTSCPSTCCPSTPARHCSPGNCWASVWTTRSGCDLRWESFRGTSRGTQESVSFDCCWECWGCWLDLVCCDTGSCWVFDLIRRTESGEGQAPMFCVSPRSVSGARGEGEGWGSQRSARRREEAASRRTSGGAARCTAAALRRRRRPRRRRPHRPTARPAGSASADPIPGVAHLEREKKQTSLNWRSQTKRKEWSLPGFTGTWICQNTRSWCDLQWKRWRSWRNASSTLGVNMKFLANAPPSTASTFVSPAHSVSWLIIGPQSVVQEHDSSTYHGDHQTHKDPPVFTNTYVSAPLRYLIARVSQTQAFQLFKVSPGNFDRKGLLGKLQDQKFGFTFLQTRTDLKTSKFLPVSRGAFVQKFLIWIPQHFHTLNSEKVCIPLETFIGSKSRGGQWNAINYCFEEVRPQVRVARGSAQSPIKLLAA